jgi:nitrate/nitrite transport system substrate-binding protein
VDKHPKAAKALLMAVQEAQQWSDRAEHKEELCKIVGGRDWFKVPVEDILERQSGKIVYGDGRSTTVPLASPLVMKFWRDHASYPFQSHDLWFLTENMRWGYLPPATDAHALVKQVNREDLWRDAAKALGVSAAQMPVGTSRGIETFFDGKKFDPAEPGKYLKSLAITRI